MMLDKTQSVMSADLASSPHQFTKDQQPFGIYRDREKTRMYLLRALQGTERKGIDKEKAQGDS